MTCKINYSMQVRYYLCSKDTSPSKPQVSEQANFWGCEGFLPKFPQTCMKSFCEFCLQIVSHKDQDLFVVWFQKKGLHVFLGPFFWRNNVGSHFCPDFQGFCQDFQRFLTNQNFWGCACTPVTYTTDRNINRSSLFLFSFDNTTCQLKQHRASIEANSSMIAQKTAFSVSPFL